MKYLAIGFGLGAGFALGEELFKFILWIIVVL